jgi:two-component system, response regulator PdtaR
MPARIMKSAPKVLIVEDEWLIAEYYRIVIEHLGYEICGIATNAADAVSLVRKEKPAAVIMDVRLSGDRDGVDAAREIYKIRELPVIYVTASREPQTSLRIKEDHPAEVLTKPVTQVHLEAALKKFCPLPD